MAVAQVTPTGCAMGNINFLTDATVVSVTSELALYPKEHIIDPHRTKRWRSTSNAQQDIIIDLGSAKGPKILALVDCNISADQTILLSLDSTTAFSTPASLTLTSYNQVIPGGTLVWYFDGWSIDRQYVRLRLPASGTADSYYEIGAMYLGTYSTFALSQGLSIKTSDPSLRSESYGGTIFIDNQLPYHLIDFDVDLLSFAEAYIYKTLFDWGTSDYTILDLHAAMGMNAWITPGAVFYGLLSGKSGFSMKVSSPTENMISVSFEEARA